MNQGLIGNWSPGIGDPTIGGWVTVLLYGAAVWTVWRLLRRVDDQDERSGRHERWFWRLLLLGLMLLTINKQLDLQSALTELGRLAAARGGWYDDRRQVQMAFISGVVIMGMTIFAAAAYLSWGAPATTHVALLGAAGLILFVAIRAASFHHVDSLLGHEIGGIRVNWLFEMGGLLVIIGSAWRRQGQR